MSNGEWGREELQARVTRDEWEAIALTICRHPKCGRSGKCGRGKECPIAEFVVRALKRALPPAEHIDDQQCFRRVAEEVEDDQLLRRAIQWEVCRVACGEEEVAADDVAQFWRFIEDGLRDRREAVLVMLMERAVPRVVRPDTIG